MINKTRSKSIICDKNNNGKGVIITCVVCEEPFYVSNYYIEKKPSICCSKKCLGKYQSMENAPRWKGKTKKYQCLQCGKKFIGKQYRLDNKNNFCSIECYHTWCSGENNCAWTGGKIECKCEKCGKKTYRHQSYIKNRKHLFCSKKCYSAWFIKENNSMYNTKGKLSPNWQGGTSFEPYGLEFNKELKEQIRKRDNYQCQLCGIKENSRNHDCHHIDYDKTNNNSINLITLCDPHNSKANHQRDKWQFFFETYQEIRQVKWLKK